MSPPSYRERLRVEGAALAGTGALLSAVLLAFVGEAGDHAQSTASQIGGVVVLLALLGPLAVRRWMARAQPVGEDAQLSGQPTPLWMPVLVVVMLASIVVVAGELGVRGTGWDAALRITLGCLAVGLVQALLLERLVAADEARTGRRYIRVPGSRAWGGTKLGFISHKRV